MFKPEIADHMPELVLGVRNYASLEARKDHAVAVYFSLDRFSLRARACDITGESLGQFVDKVKSNGLRAYLTLNTVIYPDDLPALDEVLQLVSSSDVDSIIAWDPAVIMRAIDNNIDVHISTQANVSNAETVDFYGSLGASRVVLSRELTLEQIRTIRQNTDVELEVFVHGAMCQAISGRCYLSAYLLGRSGNCGECAQPCRWGWSLVGDDGSVVKVDGKYLLSARDLCMIEHIPELVDAGVDAFKVEGRLRDSRYTSCVSRCYSQALDAYRNGEYTHEKTKDWKTQLAGVFNRGFSTGFYFGNPGPDGLSPDREMNVSDVNKVAVGVVTNYYPKVGAAAVNLQESHLKLGDEILIEGKTTYLEQEVVSLLYDAIPAKRAEKGQEIGLAVDGKVRENDKVFRLESTAES